MSKNKIIVFSDCETWEGLDDRQDGFPARVLEVTDDAMRDLMAGAYPRHLKENQIVNYWLIDSSALEKLPKEKTEEDQV